MLIFILLFLLYLFSFLLLRTFKVFVIIFIRRLIASRINHCLGQFNSLIQINYFSSSTFSSILSLYLFHLCFHWVHSYLLKSMSNCNYKNSYMLTHKYLIIYLLSISLFTFTLSYLNSERVII